MKMPPRWDAVYVHCICCRKQIKRSSMKRHLERGCHGHGQVSDHFRARIPARVCFSSLGRSSPSLAVLPFTGVKPPCLFCSLLSCLCI